jgi:hypothetical protein
MKPKTNTTEPSKFARKRTPAQREADLVAISEMYLDCKTQEEIAAWLSANRPYKLTRSQVAQDIGHLLVQWQKEANRNVKQRIASELRKLDRIERKASDEYERSKADKVETELSKKAGDPDGPAKPIRIKKTTNTGDARYLEIQVRCIERRCKILGVDAPDRQELSGPNGGPIPVEANEVSNEVVERAAKAVQEQWERDRAKADQKGS